MLDIRYFMLDVGNLIGLIIKGGDSNSFTIPVIESRRNCVHSFSISDFMIELMNRFIFGLSSKKSIYLIVIFSTVDSNPEGR